MSNESPSSILNRAANQIVTVGVARLSLDEARALVRACGGGRNTTYGILAIRLGRKIGGAPLYYHGCTDSGPKSDCRHEHLFGPDSKARIKVPRAWLNVPKRVRMLKAFIGEGVVKVGPPIDDMDLRKRWRRPDSADGSPA